MTLRLYLLLAASVLLLLAVACSDDAPAAPAVATPAPAERCVSVPPSSATPALSTATRAPTPEPTATTGSLPRADLPIVEFVRASGGSVCLPTEVLPRKEFTIGLSGRYELDERGMLFHFGGAGRGSFWMKNTHVDLSIAFVGADSRIVEIREMKAESLDYVTPGADYVYAIEAQPGWYARHGITVGDEVRFDARVTAQLPPPE